MLRALNFTVKLTKKVAPMIQTNANGNGNVQLDVFKPSEEVRGRSSSIVRDHWLRDEFITICTKAAFEGNQTDNANSVEGLHTLLNDMIEEAERNDDGEQDIDSFLDYFLSLWLGVVRFADTQSAMLAAFYRSGFAQQSNDLTTYIANRLAYLMEKTFSLDN